MAEMYFALRSRKEHRQLRMSSVELVVKPGAVPYLLYTEVVFINNSCGLKHGEVTSKQVTHANTEFPDRCFVELYRQYCSHRQDGVKDEVHACPRSHPNALAGPAHQCNSKSMDVLRHSTIHAA